MDIAEVSELNQYRDALHALGFVGTESLEQFIGAAEVAKLELASYLGVPIDRLDNTVGRAVETAARIPQDVLDTINEATYSLGAAIDNVQLSNVAFSISAPPATSCPSIVNLISQMPSILNQGKRGTCVAHAALAAYEHYLRIHGAYQDLSEQFLYWNCKRTDGYPITVGTWLGVAVPLLQRDGCCLEVTWPYVPTPVVGNEGQDPPPPGAQLKALTYRSPSYMALSPTFAPDIRNELCSKHCVAFSIPVFNSWYGSRWVANTGDITMPIPNEVRVGGHAMCMVGYLDMPGAPGIGGGRFILRNSWGTSWGINSQYGAGYGTIPYAYIAKFGVEAYSIK